MLRGSAPLLVRPLVFEPTARPCEAAVVWLHGFGDGPEGWTEALQDARRVLPQMKWLHPRAPLLPQTCYNGQRVPGWGTYCEECCTTVGSVDYNGAGIVSEAVLAELHGILDSLDAEEGIAPERVVVGGFSMGAAAAAEAALRYHRQVAGLVMLNGWLLPGAREVLEARSIEGFPMLLSHGSRDEQVGFDCGQEAARLLKQAGADVRFEVQEGLEHVASGFGPGKDHVADFLREVIKLAPPLKKRPAGQGSASASGNLLAAQADLPEEAPPQGP